MKVRKRKHHLANRRQSLHYKESNITSTRTVCTNREQNPSSSNYFLQKLKNRKNKSEVNLAPQLAKNITKHFIHQLISSNSRNPMISTRSSLPNITKKRNTQSILMCHTIQAKLKTVTVQIQSKTQKLELVKMALKRQKGVFENYRQKLFKAKTLLKMMKQQFKINKKQFGIKQVCRPLLHYRVRNFSNLLKTSQNKRTKISRDFSQQSLLNECLRMDTVKLIHSNSILSIMNSITGERLKGLWRSSQQLSDKHLFNVLQTKLTQQTQMAQQAWEQNSAGFRTIKLLFDLNFNILQSNQQSSFARHSMITQITKTKIYTNDHIQRLTRSYKTTKHQTKRKKEAIQILEKKFQELSYLYSRARKYQRVRLKRKNSDIIEKLCKRCNILFTQIRNYKFSCKYHPSEWSGTMYWCCGSLVKDSPGCTQSKHQGVDKSISRDKTKLSKCTSCLEFGHTSFNCPRDPNVRSRADSVDQIQRLSRLRLENKRKKRRKTTFLSLDPRVVDKTSDKVQDLKEIVIEERSEAGGLLSSKTYFEGHFMDPLFLMPREFLFNSRVLTKSRGTLN